MNEKVTVSKEKCLGCLYGTSGVCEMYDEFSKPMDGETCSNYEQAGEDEMAEGQQYADIVPQLEEMSRLQCYQLGTMHGANALIKQIWHKATDPKDLPEIDREVIALTTEGKVVFAHRPKESWTGKNIVTGEVTTYHPERYGAGGWNWPDIKWWLDIDIPLRGE